MLIPIQLKVNRKKSLCCMLYIKRQPRSQGLFPLFPPHTQAREASLGTRLIKREIHRVHVIAFLDKGLKIGPNYEKKPPCIIF